MSETVIKQLAQAQPGWYAKFEQKGDVCWYDPVVAWCIYDEIGLDKVYGGLPGGVIATEFDGLALAEEMNNFAGYVQSGTDPNTAPGVHKPS